MPVLPIARAPWRPSVSGCELLHPFVHFSSQGILLASYYPASDSIPDLPSQSHTQPEPRPGSQDSHGRPDECGCQRQAAGHPAEAPAPSQPGFGRPFMTSQTSARLQAGAGGQVSSPRGSRAVRHGHVEPGPGPSSVPLHKNQCSGSHISGTCFVPDPSHPLSPFLITCRT